MSRIDELIEELCPNGVPYVELGRLVKRGAKVCWDDVNELEQFRYIDLGTVDRVTHVIGDTELISRENAPSRAQQLVREGDLLFGTTRPLLKRYCVVPAVFDGQVASTGFCLLRPDQGRVLTNFLFHILGTPDFYGYVEANERGASYPAIPDNVVKKYRVPVPPLEIQREIVQILDQFTQLEAVLEAELEARRRQHVYYRNSMVSKSRFSACDWVPLASVTSIRTGSKPNSISETGDVPYVNAGNEPSGFTGSSNTQGAVVTIPSRGQGSAGHVGFQNAAFWCGPLCYRVVSTNPGILNKFLYYFLKNIQGELVALRKVGSIPAVNKSDLGKVLVPVVAVDEQLRTVNALDKFDALANDRSVGLPAELTARRKQYNYYRDKLLTFEEDIA